MAALIALSYITSGIYEKTDAETVQGSYGKTTSHNPLPKESKSGLPLRLKIPKIKVDANIDYMGLTAAGDMEAPTKIEDTGWYKHGPRPGDRGSAVIAGHVGLDEPGVFVNLNKLQKGDSLFVIDDKGQTTSFKVRETRMYNQEDQPGEVFNTSGGVHLNLITCTGAWDQVQRSFSKRLVVFTDKPD